MKRARQALLTLLPFALVVACYQGAQRDKNPPPGQPGGLCLAPDGRCSEGTCDQDRNYCFNEADPCEGFFCGGGARGECSVAQDDAPECVCTEGYENQTFTHYCCPTAGGDALCEENSGAPMPDAMGDSESGA